MFFCTKPFVSMCLIQFPLCAFRNQLQRIHSLFLAVRLYLQRQLPGGFTRYFPIDCPSTLLVWLKRENKLYFIWNMRNFIVYGNYCALYLRQKFFAGHELRLKNHLIIEVRRFKRPACLHSLRDTASNLTIYDILLIIDCKLAYYVEILTMLSGAVSRRRPELRPIFGFPSWDYLNSHSALFQALYGDK